MIHNDAHIRDDIFAKKEQEPLRAGFGRGLLAAAQKDERIVGLCADLTDSTKMAEFAKAFPERFIEIGVAEQNLAAVASGVAAFGYIPFISSYAMFSPGRNWEQIRTTICYNDRPVKIAGSHAGVSVGPDGGTHQAIEDIAITRVIPRMVVVAPCDSVEAEKATHALAQDSRPAYLRLAREKTPVMTTDETPFAIGKAYEMWRSDSPKIALMGCGPLLYKALDVARQLSEKGVGSVVVNVHTIKPLDTETVVRVAKECGRVVTIEEHQKAGGLGSAIAEVLSQQAPTPMAFVGVDDRFGQSGTPDELIAEYGLDTTDILKAAESLL